MPGGKTNTQRIEALEDKAANFAGRLDVHDRLIDAIDDLARKCEELAQGHVTRITVVERQLLVLPGFENAKDTLAAIQLNLVAISKDIDALKTWREDLRKEREERAKRFWSFGPSITAAAISGFIALAGIGIAFALNYYFLKPR